jgi:hypothetical protein
MKERGTEEERAKGKWKRKKIEERISNSKENKGKAIKKQLQSLKIGSFLYTKSPTRFYTFFFSQFHQHPKIKTFKKSAVLSYRLACFHSEHP